MKLSVLATAVMITAVSLVIFNNSKPLTSQLQGAGSGSLIAAHQPYRSNFSSRFYPRLLSNSRAISALNNHYSLKAAS